MAGDASLRLFCALRLPADALDALETWQEEYLREAATRPHTRLVERRNLHITLVFLGQRLEGDVSGVVDALREAAARTSAPRFGIRGYRETRAVGMLLLDDADGAGAALAANLGADLERRRLFGPERRPWLPHVTVLRFRERPGLRPPLPALGEVSPSDAAVYSSTLRSEGAQYEVLNTVSLGGR